MSFVHYEILSVTSIAVLFPVPASPLGHVHEPWQSLLDVNRILIGSEGSDEHRPQLPRIRLGTAPIQ